MNGELRDLDARELMEKVKARRCSLFTERTNKSDIYYISIHSEKLFAKLDENTKYYIDIVREDINGNQERITTYKDHSNLTDEEVIRKLNAFVNYTC